MISKTLKQAIDQIRSELDNDSFDLLHSGDTRAELVSLCVLMDCLRRRIESGPSVHDKIMEKMAEARQSIQAEMKWLEGFDSANRQ